MAFSVIQGVVRDSKGTPIAGARVYFVRGPVALPDIAALTSNDGGFSLSAPAAGAYEIGCSAEGYAPATTAVEVAGGGTRQVQITLKEAR